MFITCWDRWTTMTAIDSRLKAFLLLSENSAIYPKIFLFEKDVKTYTIENCHFIFGSSWRMLRIWQTSRTTILETNIVQGERIKMVIWEEKTVVGWSECYYWQLRDKVQWQEARPTQVSPRRLQTFKYDSPNEGIRLLLWGRSRTFYWLHQILPEHLLTWLFYCLRDFRPAGGRLWHFGKKEYCTFI